MRPSEVQTDILTIYGPLEPQLTHFQHSQDQ